MNDLEKAKEVLGGNEYSCVLYKGEVNYTSMQRGIAPLVQWIEEKKDLAGFSAADRIVGKAAAMLYILLGVKAVYAPVMSEKAYEVLSGRGIRAAYDTLVPAIINREGTGSCPMELTVADIGDPAQAFTALKKKIAQLKESALEKKEKHIEVTGGQNTP